LKKKNQKTFILWRARQWKKSFCFFFPKEALSYLRRACHRIDQASGSFLKKKNQKTFITDSQ